MILLITFLSLCIWHVGRLLDAPLCNFCGFCMFGCYGLSVIIGNLTTLTALLLGFLKRSKSILTGNVVYVLGVHSWMSSPLPCLGIG